MNPPSDDPYDQIQHPAIPTTLPEKMWMLIYIVPYQVFPKTATNICCFADGLFIGHEILLEGYWAFQSPPGYDIAIYAILIALHIFSLVWIKMGIVQGTWKEENMKRVWLYILVRNLNLVWDAIAMYCVVYGVWNNQQGKSPFGSSGILWVNIPYIFLILPLSYFMLKACQAMTKYRVLETA
jgi:hypothetical protein